MEFWWSKGGISGGNREISSGQFFTRFTVYILSHVPLEKNPGIILLLSRKYPNSQTCKQCLCPDRHKMLVGSCSQSLQTSNSTHRATPHFVRLQMLHLGKKDELKLTSFTNLPAVELSRQFHKTPGWGITPIPSNRRISSAGCVANYFLLLPLRQFAR